MLAREVKLIQDAAESKARIIKQHGQEINELNNTVNKVLNDVARTKYRFNDESNSYTLMLHFNPHVFGYGYDDKQHLKYLGERIGHQIAYEISSMKFIKKADDLERERYDRDRKIYAFDPMKPLY